MIEPIALSLHNYHYSEFISQSGGSWLAYTGFNYPLFEMRSSFTFSMHEDPGLAIYGLIRMCMHATTIMYTVTLHS